MVVIVYACHEEAGRGCARKSFCLRSACFMLRRGCALGGRPAAVSLQCRALLLQRAASLMRDGCCRKRVPADIASAVSRAGRAGRTFRLPTRLCRLEAVLVCRVLAPACLPIGHADCTAVLEFATCVCALRFIVPEA